MMHIRLPALLLVLLSLGIAPASALDPGTAGPFKFQPMMGKSDCYAEPGQPLPETCDLPAIPEKATPRQRATAYMARGWKLFRLFRLADAEKEFTSAAQVDPSFETQHSVARYQLTMLQMYMSEEYLKKANTYLMKAERLAPDNLDVRSSRAFYLIHKLRKSDALDLFDAVIREDGTHTSARRMRAQMHLAENRPKKALSDYNALIREYPADLDLRLARSQLNLDLGRNTDAAADLSFYIQKNPLNLVAYEMRAIAYARSGKAETGLNDLTVMLDGFKDGTTFVMGPEKRAELLSRRSFIFLDLKQHKRAVADALEAVSIGGKPRILKLQVFLKKRGFDLKIDGKVTKAMRTAIRDCFGIDKCVAQIFRQI